MMSRYIEEVQLINFQDHADTTINLTNGINLIIGSSDAGKSAILRALNYVFHNSLKGENFIRVGTEECTVRVKFSDGIEVSRVKGGDTNSYVLKDIDGNYHTFSKVGTSVPEPVKNALGQPPLDDKKKPISYADQMSSLFLVDLSPTDLPRTLSELTGTHNLQNAAESLQKNSRSYDRIIKEKSDKIDKLNKDLEQYDYVDKDYDKIEKIEEKLKNIKTEYDKVKLARDFVNSNNDIAKEAKKTKDALAKDNLLISLKKTYLGLEEKSKTWANAKSYLQIYASHAKEYKKKKTVYDNLSSFLSEDNKIKFNEISSRQKLITKAESYQSTYFDLKEKYEKANINLKNEITNIQTLTKELNDIKAELQNNGNWCESCDRPLI